MIKDEGNKKKKKLNHVMVTPSPQKSINTVSTPGMSNNDSSNDGQQHDESGWVRSSNTSDYYGLYSIIDTVKESLFARKTVLLLIYVLAWISVCKSLQTISWAIFSASSYNKNFNLDNDQSLVYSTDNMDQDSNTASFNTKQNTIQTSSTSPSSTSSITTTILLKDINSFDPNEDYKIIYIPLFHNNNIGKRRSSFHKNNMINHYFFHDYDDDDTTSTKNKLLTTLLSPLSPTLSLSSSSYSSSLTTKRSNNMMIHKQQKQQQPLHDNCEIEIIQDLGKLCILKASDYTIINIDDKNDDNRAQIDHNEDSNNEIKDLSIAKRKDDDTNMENQVQDKEMEGVATGVKGALLEVWLFSEVSSYVDQYPYYITLNS